LGTFFQLPEYVRREMRLLEGDITNTSFINRIASEMKLDELYHLAAQSSVADSFANPSATYDTNMGSTLNVVNTMPRTRLYFAASSEMFGRSEVWLDNGRV